MKKKTLQEVYAFSDLENWAEQAAGLAPPVRLGVIGDPVAHSLSPALQNAALREAGVEAQYARFHIRPNELARTLPLFRKAGFLGLNLTVPHKIAALALLDHADEEAKAVGAVNTIAFREGKSFAYNTDGAGFVRAIRSEFSVDLKDLRVLLLGAGGAARAIAWQCARAQCERLAIVNRTLDKAEKMVAELRPGFAGPRVLGPVARVEAVPWDENALRFQIANSDLLVNATPVGLSPEDRSVLPATLLAPHLMVYDTVYGKRRTPLLAAAAEAGARGADGLSMLLHQGARSFEIWFGRDAPLEVMRAALESRGG